MIYDELKQIIDKEDIKAIGTQNPNFCSPMGNIMYYSGIKNISLAPSFISWDYDNKGLGGIDPNDKDQGSDKIKIDRIKEVEYLKSGNGLGIYLKGSND
jgi:hypothetical protein